MAPPDSLSPRLALFLTIQGLGTNLVGCYGNSVAPTPHLDALASRGIVIDQLWSDSVEVDRSLHSLWSGSHALSRITLENHYSLWREQIGRGLLITDDFDIANSVAAECFERVILVEQDPAQDSDEASSDPREMEFERLVEAAIGTWSECLSDHPLLWIHSKGLSGTWDAPYEYREILCDDEDPAPPTDTSPMEMRVDQKTDPDDIFGISCAVGGQIIGIDQAIGDLIGSLREMGLISNCLVGVLGVSGFSLGEHGYVGGKPEKLYAETLHIPGLLLPGEKLPLGGRQGAIMQPHNLGEWLQEWFRDHPTSESLQAFLESLCDSRYDGETRIGAAIACEKNQEYVCSPAWSLRLERPESSKEQIEQLYTKPDDRWEQNEVSSRALHIVEKMGVLKGKLQEHYKAPIDDREPLNWLSEELIHPIR
jgi:hypothetical protein